MLILQLQLLKPGLEGFPGRPRLFNRFFLLMFPTLVLHRVGWEFRGLISTISPRYLQQSIIHYTMCITCAMNNKLKHMLTCAKHVHLVC